MKTTLSVFEQYVEKYHFIPKGIGIDRENRQYKRYRQYKRGKRSLLRFSYVPFMEETAHFNCNERNICFIPSCHALICI